MVINKPESMWGGGPVFISLPASETIKPADGFWVFNLM